MGKLYVRIDDRLIHGQIVTAWCVTLGVQEIIAIDNALAGDAMMQSIMTMGVPAQYNPKIVTGEQAKKILQTPTDKTRLVITRFCRSLADIEQEIQSCEHVNIGNCSKQDDSVFNFRGIGIGQVVSLTQPDVDTLNRLEAAGIDVICQVVPTEKRRSWESMKKNG